MINLANHGPCLLSCMHVHACPAIHHRNEYHATILKIITTLYLPIYNFIICEMKQINANLVYNQFYINWDY